MRRGTTFDLEIELENVDLEHVAQLYIDFACLGSVVIHKTISDVEIDGHTVKVHLSQTDTLKLTPRTKVAIQARILTTDGEAVATDIIKRDVEEILEDGAISAGSGK